MITSCPSCGNLEFDTTELCLCGYHDDKSYNFEDGNNGSNVAVKEKPKRRVVKNPVNSSEHRESDEIIIKEIDSWIFSYSEADRSIVLSTPTLQPFKLNFSLNDLEELLELIYQRTGEDKTLRKSCLSAEDLPALINTVNKMIEEKRSKISLKFDSDELDGILDLINLKLKG